MSCIYFRISYCQDVSFYMHIDDSDFIPVKTKSNSDGYIEVKTKKIEFDYKTNLKGSCLGE